MTFRTLAYGGIRHSVKACIAEVTCHALSSLDTSTTVVCLRTQTADVLIRAGSILIGLFIHASGTKRLTLNT